MESIGTITMYFPFLDQDTNVEQGIASRMDLYEDVRKLGKQITEMRETAKRMANEAFQERSD